MGWLQGKHGGGDRGGIGPKEADALVRGGAVLLDVREPAEWQAGHVPGAFHVPLGQLEGRLAALPAGPTRRGHLPVGEPLGDGDVPPCPLRLRRRESPWWNAGLGLCRAARGDRRRAAGHGGVRLLLTLPLGLVVGLALGALGGGGSILAVPALVYVVGLGAKEAVTTSLVIVGVAALGGMVGHWRAGRVRVAAGLWFSLAGVAGSLLGTRLNRSVNPDVLLAAFAVVMMIAAWRMWVTARSQDRFAATAAAAMSSSSGPTPRPTRPAGIRAPRAIPTPLRSTTTRPSPRGSQPGLASGCRRWPRWWWRERWSDS